VTKRELAAKVAEDCGLSKTQAAATIDSLFDGIAKSLKKGEPVTFVGFGTFAAPERVARFSAGKALKNALTGR